uniref:Uncharacterized protein n=1 Tax=Avena sativa TaxID=4498 RepID=A0ACD5ZHD4_AVESA
MEAAEDASLEPAIRWLAQSILASPLIHEQAPWVREAGLAQEMEGLKSEIKAVQVVVSVIKGRALGNEPLAESLVELKELLYDADDMVDELDYCRLLQQDQEDDLDQTDGHHGTSIENAHVPSTGTLPDPRQTDGHGTQLVEILSDTLPNPLEMDGHGRMRVERSRGNFAVQGSKLRSELWKEFKILEFEQNGAPVRAKCKHCDTELACPTSRGTGVLKNHLKSKACLHKKYKGSDPLSTSEATTHPAPSLATGNLSCIKRRRDEESTRLGTANTNRWNKDDFSKMIRDITCKLHHIRKGLIPVLSILGSDFAANSNHSQGETSHQRRRTTGILQGSVYGRDDVKNEIIELIERRKFAIPATVLPILGITGVGKTALAQHVHNHPDVKKQFDHTVWVWVSNNFDATELTEYMLTSVSQDQETHVGLCSFAKLQEILESRIKSKRVLLILDDVWDGITDYQWNQLLAPFNSGNARGNMIILTTRKPCVAKRRGTASPITLGALESDDFWSFFSSCAFGNVNNEKKESLSDLGQQIAQKLKGNPLAAETAGALLGEHHTVTHWSSILKNEDWKSLTLSGGIMSALKICYDQLPYHLQQCFSYCSLFSCNYEFLAEELVCIWISQGFVKSNNSSKSLEEIGRAYLANLANLGFFEEFEKISPSGLMQIRYVMYNLMHDFARVVSRPECATIDGLECNRMSANVRHLSIISNSTYQMDDQTGDLACSEKFEKILQNTITSVGKLRPLVLIGQYGSSFFQFFQTALKKTHNLRVLYFSATSADFRSFLCSLVNPAHLRYLKLENGHAEQVALPQVLSKSFHLQVLDVNQYSGTSLASLQTVHLDNSGEPQILPSLERLRFLRRLKLSNFWNVREVSLPSLEELVLFEMPKLKTCSCTSVGDLLSSLRVLEIQRCPVLEVFDLFQKVDNYQPEHNPWFPSLKKLIICDCPNLHVKIPLPHSATVLNIDGSSRQALRIKPNRVLDEMILDDKFLSFHNMRDLKYLEIMDCCNLVSISLKTFGHLTSLKSLKIENCEELLSSSDEDHLILSNAGALPSLESLHIESCEITGKWLSLMLGHSPNLKELYLEDCPRLTQLQIEEDRNFQSSLTAASEASSSGFYSLTSSATDGLCRIPLDLTSSLRKITISDSPNLIFDKRWNGLAGFTSLEKLTIQYSSELISSLVHNDGQADGRWPLPQSLEELDICGYYFDKTLQPCFVGNLTHLRKLEIRESPDLKSLQLNSCTAMQYLSIFDCTSLAAIEGFLSLVNLRELDVVDSHLLASLATSVDGYDCSQFSGLQSLGINELSLLTTSFWEGLSSLRILSLKYLKEARLTDEQERALLLHGSLQELTFYTCSELLDIPAVLHSLTSLKTLKIEGCDGISRLSNEGLPPSLEVLEIKDCTSELSAQCRSLATDKLRVKIDGHFVN